MSPNQIKYERRPDRPRRRAGSVLLEFILAFPIILIFSMAIIEFGFFALLQQSITAAAIEGSKEAGRVGSTDLSIRNLIQEYVATNSLNLSTSIPASANSGTVLVVIQRFPVTTQTIGNSSIPCSPVGPDPAFVNEVKVTICANLTDTAGVTPIPNLLSKYGFSLTGKQVEISAMSFVEL